ncbi:uncharacterized protein LOC134527346 [Bacillus rossius redtenbacheri]|uniref:uncharacterized protein LOC134527346 n=1 Tax=Bacillus rossius redtenbacheri TaxID=93214 RepID=UPI002FDDF05D
MHGELSSKTGGQPVLTEEEENVIVAHLITVATFGFPFTILDLRLVVKSYLDRLGRIERRFQRNLPGKDWADLFLRRHKKELTQRTARPISRVRAALDKDVIVEYFNHLGNSIDGVPPSHNIWNYDETNITDDPGNKKVLVKRGTKYPDQIKNSTKASVSVMMCGNAAGEMAPPYVTYKAEGLYQSWTEGGPRGTRYNRSKSGWFDARIFEDWFEGLMLPILKKQDGVKILIGDNLSSHINYHVVELCEANNIRFVALPPNSTHLLQPLDVGFFRPMKGAWRNILNEWKESDQGRKLRTIPKESFPVFLKMLVENLKEKSSQNLKSGFQACGIVPLNQDAVLKKLVGNEMASSDLREHVAESFLNEMEKKRKSVVCVVQRKRKKIDVPPGKGFTTADIPHMIQSQPTTLMEIQEQQPSTSGVVQEIQQKPRQTSGTRKMKAIKRKQKDFSSEEEEESEKIIDDESEDSVTSNFFQDSSNSSEEDKSEDEQEPLTPAPVSEPHCLEGSLEATTSQPIRASPGVE